jgi:uncharacterized protein YndB with AHSA1/START domain
MPEPSATTLVLSRRIKAPPSKVFAAWTDPAKMKRWFGPSGAEILRLEADTRVGGHFRVHMRMPDGAEHEASGVYREVVPNERLVFTWTWKSTPERETLVTVLIQGDSGGTRLTLMHDRLFDELDRDNHESGWSEALDRLETHLSSH